MTEDNSSMFFCWAKNKSRSPQLLQRPCAWPSNWGRSGDRFTFGYRWTPLGMAKIQPESLKPKGFILMLIFSNTTGLSSWVPILGKKTVESKPQVVLITNAERGWIELNLGFKSGWKATLFWAFKKQPLSRLHSMKAATPDWTCFTKELSEVLAHFISSPWKHQGRGSGTWWE